MSDSDAARQKRWWKRHPDRWRKQKNQYYQRSQAEMEFSATAATRWMAWEIAQIIDPNRPCDRVLSRLLGRTICAIQQKRAKVLKMLNDSKG